MRNGNMLLRTTVLLSLMVLAGCPYVPPEPPPCANAFDCVEVQPIEDPKCRLLNGADVKRWAGTKLRKEPPGAISISMDEHGFHPNPLGGIDETHTPVLREVVHGKWEPLRCQYEQNITDGPIHRYEYIKEVACYVGSCALSESDETGNLPKIPPPPVVGNCEALCAQGEPNCIKHVLNRFDPIDQELEGVLNRLVETLLFSPLPQRMELDSLERLLTKASGQQCDRDALEISSLGRALYSGDQCSLWFPANLEDVGGGWDIDGVWIVFPSTMDGSFSRVPKASGRWTLPDTGRSPIIRWQLVDGKGGNKENREFTKWVDISAERRLTFTGDAGYCLQIVGQ